MRISIQTDRVEKYDIDQLNLIATQECLKDHDISIVCMPDIHPGKIGPIGLTMMERYDPNNSIILPGLIGPDIGCGVSVFTIDYKRKDLDFNKLDKVIKQYIPVGSAHHDGSKECEINEELLKSLNYFSNEDYTIKAIKENLGTLGGGNHFIEVDKDSSNNIYLIIHTGSRNIGYKTYKHFMDSAKCTDIPFEMRYLKDDDFVSYFEASQGCMKFARMNRMTIAKTIANNMKWKLNPIIDSFHNYITVETIDEEEYLILRKGACAALKGDGVIIPINMRDGAIIGKGKGNKDWNFSAPHGSGRKASRIEIVQSHTVSEYKKVMKGIHSSTINTSTLDEAPFAYRSIDDILPYIEESVKVTKIIKPIYNYKAEDRE